MKDICILVFIHKILYIYKYLYFINFIHDRDKNGGFTLQLFHIEKYNMGKIYIVLRKRFLSFAGITLNINDDDVSLQIFFISMTALFFTIWKLELCLFAVITVGLIVSLWGFISVVIIWVDIPLMIDFLSVIVLWIFLLFLSKMILRHKTEVYQWSVHISMK